MLIGPLAGLAAVFEGLGPFYAVLALGFIAAVSLGSVAWYNSKRPAGWEDKERPDFLPKVDDEP
ncbi:hypothetical protein RIF25_05580 [Thermosynechococcaceae cyanobacterium BACA0444]|uniref:Uncharacterized protein n=1 Tax=Pseudocalidococcus azoricus BACA0444 TaxID=2918990 RepID=A0AAE4FR81_9CYAN|nr:hypothetical protein [Pseudocalidococcus azoricus]MDS3860273.1 hypothetical protein [Pseudocalidococcus azoricus BACA0444]